MHPGTVLVPYLSSPYIDTMTRILQEDKEILIDMLDVRIYMYINISIASPSDIKFQCSLVLNGRFLWHP